MKTYVNQQNASSQAFHDFHPDFNNIFQKLKDFVQQSKTYHSYYAPILAKFTMLNITMKTVEPGQVWVGDEIGCCDRTVRRGLDPLQEIGFIKSIFRYAGKGRERTNLYEFHPIAKTKEFLEFLAQEFHEVRLYLIRVANEAAFKALDIEKQKAILSKIAPNQHSQKGVLQFNLINFFIKNNNNIINKEDFLVNTPQKKSIELVQRLAALLDCTDENVESLKRHSDHVLLAAEKAYVLQGVASRIDPIDRFRYFMGICKKKSADFGQRMAPVSAEHLDKKVDQLIHETGYNNAIMKNIMKGDTLKKAHQIFVKQKQALEQEQQIGLRAIEYRKLMDNSEDGDISSRQARWGSQKGIREAHVVSENALLSYRKYSGELPSLAPSMDIKKTFIDNFGTKIVDNFFTRSLHSLFKEK